jgi:Holliday junction DNA helicase RuvA
VIGRLQGVLLEKQAPDLLIDVQGVGYEVQASLTTFFALPAVGEQVTLHTHFVVREDAQLLYGFAEARERTLFRTLIKVNGVGPKMGLAILSGMNPDDFVRSVRNDDVKALTRLPGVGKKTAERLIIEMRDRLKDWGAERTGSDSSGTAPTSMLGPSVRDEAESALITLGYKPQDAAKMVAAAAKSSDDSLSCEELIRRALRGTIG